MLVPFCIAVHFVPVEHLVMRIGIEADRGSYITDGDIFSGETKVDLFPNEPIPLVASPTSHPRTVRQFDLLLTCPFSH